MIFFFSRLQDGAHLGFFLLLRVPLPRRHLAAARPAGKVPATRPHERTTHGLETEGPSDPRVEVGVGGGAAVVELGRRVCGEGLRGGGF